MEIIKALIEAWKVHPVLGTLTAGIVAYSGYKTVSAIAPHLGEAVKSLTEDRTFEITHNPDKSTTYRFVSIPANPGIEAAEPVT